MGARRKGREYALQALYLMDITKMPPKKAFRGIFAGEEQIEKQIEKFAESLFNGTVLHLTELDEKIKEYAQNWDITRMAALDRNIIRLGAYEMLYETDTPVSVIIDEAVEIAKTFSTPDSNKFVNGILDRFKTERKNISRPSD